MVHEACMSCLSCSSFCQHSKFSQFSSPQTKILRISKCVSNIPTSYPYPVFSVFFFFFKFHFFRVWMPTLYVMELGRQLCLKMRKPRKPQTSSSPASIKGLEIHFYRFDIDPLKYPKGHYTAENLCVDAAKKCCKWLTCLQNCHLPVLWFNLFLLQ